MTQQIDIAALRQAAHEAYLQRGWAAQPMQYDKGVVGGDDDWIVHEVGSGCVARSVEKGDAQYIAAANPAVILALLDRLEQAEKDAARMEWYFGEADKGPWMNTYLQGCREGWTADQWRASISAAMQGEGA